MTTEEITDKVFNLIREQGYISAAKLGFEMYEKCFENGSIDTKQVLLAIQDVSKRDGIRVVEYTDAHTEDYRHKDLYYYLPEEK